MANRYQLIEAIKNLDFDLLHVLLDDDRSYMNVTKSLFLETLEENIRQYSNLKAYEEALEGTCGICFKDLKGYKFIAKGCPSLSLLFYEENNEVIDLFLCKNLVTNKNPDNDYIITFSFYDDQEVDFQPSLEHIMNVQHVDNAMDEFYSLKQKNIVSLKDIIHWIQKHKDLIRKLKLDNMTGHRYLAFNEIRRTYQIISSIEDIYEENELAKQSLANYQSIDKNDEKSVIKNLKLIE